MVDDDLATTLVRLLGDLPQVNIGEHIHNRNFLVGKKVFAFMNGGGVALKLPRQKALELVEQERAIPLVMGKRVMKEWVVLKYAEPEEVASDLGLFQEAIAYVAAQK